MTCLIPDKNGTPDVPLGTPDVISALALRIIGITIAKISNKLPMFVLFIGKRHPESHSRIVQDMYPECKMKRDICPRDLELFIKNYVFCFIF